MTGLIYRHPEGHLVFLHMDDQKIVEIELCDDAQTFYEDLKDSDAVVVKADRNEVIGTIEFSDVQKVTLVLNDADVKSYYDTVHLLVKSNPTLLINLLEQTADMAKNPRTGTFPVPDELATDHN